MGTSAEEIDRQMNDDSWRRKKEEVLSEDDEDKSENSDSDTEGDGKGAQKVIDVQNPNRVQNKMKKADDITADGDGAKPELTRREREAIEKEQARLRYEKLHAEGKTDEARADLARLALVRKQREEAAKKKLEDQKDKESKAKSAEEARKAALLEAQMNAPGPGRRRKKR